MSEKNKSGFDEMQIAKQNSIGHGLFLATLASMVIAVALAEGIEGFNLAYAVLTVCGVAMLLDIVLRIKTGTMVSMNYKLMDTTSVIMWSAFVALTIVLFILRHTINPDWLPEQMTILIMFSVICALRLMKDIAARVIRRRKDDDE